MPPTDIAVGHGMSGNGSNLTAFVWKEVIAEPGMYED